MFKISIISVHKRVLYLFVHFLFSFLRNTSLVTCVPHKKKTSKLTLLRSPHINKSSKEQFSLNHYKIVLYVKQHPNAFLIKWLLINKPRVLSLKLTLLSS